jgi:uncharacterized protein (TIRG00374 family)
VTFNLLKYLLAGGLLTYVVWSNWGQSGRVASRIEVVNAGKQPPSNEGPPIIEGTVQEFDADHSITVIDASGQSMTFELVKIDWALFKLSFVRKPAKIEPDPGAIQPGMTKVAVWEHPGRGLAYVWREHVVEGKPIHWGYLGLAAFILTLSVLLTFLRWYYLVRAQDLPFRGTDALRLGIIGFFFNNFMPGSVGGDAIKAVFLAREQKHRRTVAVATVVMDRAIALWALVWFAAVCGLLFWACGLLEGQGASQSRFIIKVATGIVVVSLAGWLALGLLPPHRAERFAVRLSRLPKVGHSVGELWRAVWMYRCRQRSVAMTMLISWIGHVGFVLSFYFSALVLLDDHDPMQRIPSLAQHFLIVPIGLVINALPVSIGGAGFAEYGFGELYRWLGASMVCGVLGMLVYRAIQWVLSFIGYLFYLRLRRTLQVAVEPAPESNGSLAGELARPVAAGEPAG